MAALLVRMNDGVGVIETEAVHVVFAAQVQELLLEEVGHLGS
jgi:hypothetical protein